MPDSNPSEIIERLAERLHRKMEHLDPGPAEVTWAALSEYEREFYRICVSDLLSEATCPDTARC